MTFDSRTCNRTMMGSSRSFVGAHFMARGLPVAANRRCRSETCTMLRPRQFDNVSINRAQRCSERSVGKRKQKNSMDMVAYNALRVMLDLLDTETDLETCLLGPQQKTAKAVAARTTKEGRRWRRRLLLERRFLRRQRLKKANEGQWDPSKQTCSFWYDRPECCVLTPQDVHVASAQNRHAFHGSEQRACQDRFAARRDGSR